jgi:hypothetical protein
MIFENNLFGVSELNFCVDATAGNHILEVYGSSRVDKSSRWTFQVNGGKWQDVTQENLNKFKRLEQIKGDTVVEFGTVKVD